MEQKMRHSEIKKFWSIGYFQLKSPTLKNFEIHKIRIVLCERFMTLENFISHI